MLMVHVQLILPQRVNQPNHMPPSVLWKVGFLVFSLLPYGKNNSDLLNAPYVFEHLFFCIQYDPLGKVLCGDLQPSDLVRLFCCVSVM